MRSIIGSTKKNHRNNVMGTHVMLEAAKVHKVKRFIHVSTDEVYGEVVSQVSSCPFALYLGTKKVITGN